MNVIICVLLAFAIAINASPLESFGTVSIATIGHVPTCVIAGKKLYINGIYQKELDGAETEELKEYKENVKKQRENAARIIQQARKEKISKAMLIQNQKSLLEGPARPSFCSLNDTLPIFLDGCMIQNKKLYVGKDFVRDLSEDEVEQLNEYEKKKLEYQRYLTSTIHQRVQSLFDRQNSLWDLFTGDSSALRTTTETPTSTLASDPIQEPEAPDLCTAIY